ILDPNAAVPTMERPLRLLSKRRRHTSFLKISEGCDHACAFCAIPLMRGKHRSAPIEQLVREAREPEAAGVVELGLISQDTTWYGRDLARRPAGGIELAAGTPAPASSPQHPSTGNPGGADGFFVGRPFARMAGVEAEAL